MDQCFIKIKRPSANGPLRVYKVELDGFFVGKLGSRSELNIPTCRGIHTLSFIFMGKVEKTIQVNIQNEQDVILINSKLNMWSGKIELEMVNNYQISSVSNIESVNSIDILDGAIQVNKKKVHPVVIVAIIIVFLCIIFVGIIVSDAPNDTLSSSNMDSSISNDEKITESNVNTATIEIPDVVGLDYDTAKKQLENIDVEFTTKYTYDSFKTNCNTPKDTVVNQSLLGKVEKGSKLIVVVAKPAISISKISLDTNYVGGIDTRISFINNSDKQIAYTYFNLKYFDRMGYPAYCSITNKSNANLKFTGPINANESKNGYWDAVIYNSATGAVQPQTIEIVFTDGTSQTITNTGAFWYTESYYGGELHN